MNVLIKRLAICGVLYILVSLRDKEVPGDGSKSQS